MTRDTRDTTSSDDLILETTEQKCRDGTTAYEPDPRWQQTLGNGRATTGSFSGRRCSSRSAWMPRTRCTASRPPTRPSRDLRRQRRTLRSKKYRRQWFAEELAKLGLPKPVRPPHDPISLRLRALNGEVLEPEELHAALAHLFKRRGYSKVPWANSEMLPKNPTSG